MEDLTPEQYDYMWQLKMIDLKKLNTDVFYAHCAMGVIAVGLSALDSTIGGVKIPIRTSYTDWNEDTEVAY